MVLHRSQGTMKLVGIFSREDESCYQWLSYRLVRYKNVKDVRSVTITNSFQRFQEETSKCNFAILYHSKKRGRVNVTDVTDSLYDEELQYLSDEYGRENVLVVIDDLDSSSEEEKRKILAHQPKIRDLAKELFIFSAEDKAALNDGGYQTLHSPPSALNDIRRIIEGNKERVVHDIERQTDGEFSPPSQRRRQLSRRCLVGLIFLIGFGAIILIIVLSQKSHEPVTPTPANITGTPKYHRFNINMTITGAYNESWNLVSSTALHRGTLGRRRRKVNFRIVDSDPNSNPKTNL